MCRRRWGGRDAKLPWRHTSCRGPGESDRRSPFMKVDFIVRSDHDEKFGGDRLQVEQYCSHLHGRGVETRVVPYRPRMQLSSGAIAHIVNVDRPYDFLSAVRQVRGPYVVSPIHHDLGCVRAMRKAEPIEGVRSVIGWLPESARELAAFGARSWRGAAERAAAVREGVRGAGALPRVWSQVGRALNRAGAVALLARGEGDSLRHDTGWDGANGVLIPNGKPERAAVVEIPWANRSNDVVVVGRIEPRKRQVEIGRVASVVGVPMTFIGPLSGSSPSYSEKFMRLVEESASLRWLGALPHDEVIAAMGARKVLLNMSWVEVQSLVDLEAASAGCFVVAAASGNSAEWLGAHVTVRGPEDLLGALDAAAELANRDQGPADLRYEQTWQRATGQLLDVYGALGRGE